MEERVGNAREVRWRTSGVEFESLPLARLLYEQDDGDLKARASHGFAPGGQSRIDVCMWRSDHSKESSNFSNADTISDESYAAADALIASVIAADFLANIEETATV